MADKVVEDGAALRKERTALEAKLRSLLWSCNTIKRLRELWPKGERFFPIEGKAVPTALVPASLAADINAALGIK